MDSGKSLLTRTIFFPLLVACGFCLSTIASAAEPAVESEANLATPVSTAAHNRNAASLDNTVSATLQIYAGRRSKVPISRYLTGKFCEHLGNNIYNGMDAQILLNPTMAALPFSTGQESPDGITTFHYDQGQIAQQIHRKDSHLPILRWPGGNFVSGYH